MVRRLIVDTGVLVEFERDRLDPREILGEDDAAIAAISVAESETVTSGEQVPIPFALAVDTSALDPRARYAFRATIEVDGSISFTTTASHPLPAEVPAAEIEILVKPVQPAAIP